MTSRGENNSHVRGIPQTAGNHDFFELVAVIGEIHVSVLRPLSRFVLPRDCKFMRENHGESC